MPFKSEFVLLVENLSSLTRSSDIKCEFEYCGTVQEVERDIKSKSALVEMRKAGDAEYAWRKMDGLKVDGKKWKVEYAIKADFKYFGWKWTEPASPSRTPSRSPSVVNSDQSD